jgi:hypothetical protein
MPHEETFPVPVVLKDGTIIQGRFLTDEESKGCRLVLCFGDRSITKEALDTFEALVQIRRDLEAEGMQVFCYGACKDVRPSGMSRSMGGGFRAYRHVFGRRTSCDEMVHILESGPDIVPVTVNEQQLYWAEWLQSVGIRRSSLDS